MCVSAASLQRRPAICPTPGTFETPAPGPAPAPALSERDRSPLAVPTWAIAATLALWLSIVALLLTIVIQNA